MLRDRKAERTQRRIYRISFVDLSSCPLGAPHLYSLNLYEQATENLLFDWSPSSCIPSLNAGSTGPLLLQTPRYLVVVSSSMLPFFVSSLPSFAPFISFFYSQTLCLNPALDTFAFSFTSAHSTILFTLS